MKNKNNLDLVIQENFQKDYDESDLFSKANHPKDGAELLSGKSYTYLISSMRRFTKNRVAFFFFLLLLFTIIFMVLQPYFPGQESDPLKIYNDSNGVQIRNAPPNEQFILGTNAIGQDLWSLTWSGARTSLFIGAMVSVIETVLGVFFGIIWGYSKSFDFVFTGIYNIINNIPQTLALVVISYALRPGVTTIILALSLTGWLITARYIRNQVILLRDKDYVLASRCLGTSTVKIVFRNLFPYIISIITMRMSMAIPFAISNEVFVSYLGLGLPQNKPSLGNLIVLGIDKMMEPSLRYQLLFPSAILTLVSVSFYVAGNAFADAFDPKNHDE